MSRHELAARLLAVPEGLLSPEAATLMCIGMMDRPSMLVVGLGGGGCFAIQIYSGPHPEAEAMKTSTRCGSTFNKQ